MIQSSKHDEACRSSSSRRYLLSHSIPVTSQLASTDSCQFDELAAHSSEAINQAHDSLSKVESLGSGLHSNTVEFLNQSLDDGKNDSGCPDFQYSFYSPSVGVKWINIAQRSTFELNRYLSLELWKQKVEDISLRNSRRSLEKRISPSYRHLEVLHSIQQMQNIRQLCFSRSTCIDSDYFCYSKTGIMELFDDNDNETDLKIEITRQAIINNALEVGSTGNESCNIAKRTRKWRHFYNGSYRSINPITTIRNDLPPETDPPYLIHQKQRLPMRSDVGLANASMIEVTLKQKEVQFESAWEETSPRIVLVITSFDIGEDIVDGEEFENDSHSKSSDRLMLNAGGLSGIPFAGRDLILAIKRNAFFFGNLMENISSNAVDKTSLIAQALRPRSFSVLAPPLDASYSPSQGWRPRVTHDRQALTTYFLTCPLSLEVYHENSIPIEGHMVGCLTLYQLPSDGKFIEGNSNAQRFGKISESFWFPVGEWKSQLPFKTSKLDPIVGKSNSENCFLDENVFAQWLNRKQKAIFSYSKLTPDTISDPNSVSLFVVIEVLEQMQLNPHFDSRNGVVKDDTSLLNFYSNRESHTDDINTLGENVPSHLLRPICFGVCKLFCLSEFHNILDSTYIVPSKADSALRHMIWPNGRKQDIQLFHVLNEPLSQDDFIALLCDTIFHQGESMCSESQNLSQLSTTSKSDFVNSSEVHLSQSNKKHRKLGSRLFRASKSRDASLQFQRIDNPPTAFQTISKRAVVGSATIFYSLLMSDLVQSMLSFPPELYETNFHADYDETRTIPSLLIDITGQYAVCREFTNRCDQQSLQQCRRSNLLRLSSKVSSQGLYGLAEFREVLQTPIRTGKYDLDEIVSHQSLLNLLFLYPRLLRRSTSIQQRSSLHTMRYTIRLRVIRMEQNYERDGLIETKTVPVNCFYSSCPWTKLDLLDSYYSNLYGSTTEQKLVEEIQMRDEVKLNLPHILDGSYSLEFCLFEVQQVTKNLLKIVQVADASVPLSCSGPRGTNTINRVATIIPNGKHRLELGGFQLQFETRLFSSIHVADPAIATLLRDFPIAQNSYLNVPESQILSGSSITSASSTYSSTDLQKLIPSILLDAQDTSVHVHFTAILHLHLQKLVDFGRSHEIRYPHSHAIIIMEGVSILIQKVKAKFESLENEFQTRFDAFCKMFIDSFDEQCLSSKYALKERETKQPLEDLDRNNRFLEEDNAHFEEEKIRAIMERSAFNQSQSTRVQRRRKRISLKRIPTGESSGIPFSRVAFGVSITDRMRLEAEHDFVGEQHVSMYFDDDESVTTSSSGVTWTALRQGVVSTRNMYSSEASIQNDTNLVRSSFVAPASSAGIQSNNGDFSKRVKFAAQVILAPCVGPSLSNILATGGKDNHIESSRGISVQSEFRQSAHILERENHNLLTPGTDDEMENCKDHLLRHIGAAQYHGYVLRRSSNIQTLSFSLVDLGDEIIHVETGEFLYETICVVWLDAYVKCFEKSITKDNNSFCINQELQTIPLPMNLQAKDWDSSAKFLYISLTWNLDFLLPLALKSFLLRCNLAIHVPQDKVLLDEGHLAVTTLFLRMLVRGLLGYVLSEDANRKELSQVLLRTLSKAKYVEDFLVGVAAVVHPEQVQILIRSYLIELRAVEIEKLSRDFVDGDFRWSVERLHVVICSRQLRLSTLERLAVLPSFIVINYASKHGSLQDMNTNKKQSWLCQHVQTSTSPSTSSYDSEVFKLPRSGWLSDIVVMESLSVCSLSLQSIVVEATTNIELSCRRSSISLETCLKMSSNGVLARKDLFVFQSTAIHAITLIYELVVRRHAMDRRFQSESCRERIAFLLAFPILESSVLYVRWLTRLEPNNKIRSIWLLVVIYILQESPEVLIRDFIRSSCDFKENRLHGFLRLLRLSTSSFQNFDDRLEKGHSLSEFISEATPWLRQECFNTICSTINIIVEEIQSSVSRYPEETTKIIRAVFDLLLYITSIPQSTVTSLRGMGGALYALEQFGIDFFVENCGKCFQNWSRLVLCLMNSISLSLRSIAVDFVVCIFGTYFDLHGNIDSLLIVFASLLPEVVAREVALFSVSGLISSHDDIARALWPIRRSLSDLEDTSPYDDDRVDRQLAPMLCTFCRACQAIIDSVLVEMRLRRNGFMIAGRSIDFGQPSEFLFDSDEESLFEAAAFFSPEMAPLQRLRWLISLICLHEEKEQWAEAAETLLLCADTIMTSIPHLNCIWRPSRSIFWENMKILKWQQSSLVESFNTKNENLSVINFAADFLEPKQFLGVEWSNSLQDKLKSPTITDMCSLLEIVISKCTKFYLHEEGMEELAYKRIEPLLNSLVFTTGFHNSQAYTQLYRPQTVLRRVRDVNDLTALRKAFLCTSTCLSTIAGRLFSTPKLKSFAADRSGFDFNALSLSDNEATSFSYVYFQLTGPMPHRFTDNTIFPSFVEWEKPFIFRVRKSVVDRVRASGNHDAYAVCEEFARPFTKELQKMLGVSNVVMRMDSRMKVERGLTVVNVFPADVASIGFIPHVCVQCKHFFHKNDFSIVEDSVALEFPCVLSRQRSILTTVIVPTKGDHCENDEIQRTVRKS